MIYPKHNNTRYTSADGEWQIGFGFTTASAEYHTGWFEWIGGDNSDDAITGELIFDKGDNGRLELVDYDGVFALPQPIAALLIEHDVIVGSEFIDGEDE